MQQILNIMLKLLFKTFEQVGLYLEINLLGVILSFIDVSEAYEIFNLFKMNLLHMLVLTIMWFSIPDSGSSGVISRHEEVIDVKKELIEVIDRTFYFSSLCYVYFFRIFWYFSEVTKI